MNWFLQIKGGLFALATIAGAVTILVSVARARKDAAVKELSGEDLCKIARYLNGKANCSVSSL